MNNSKIFFIFIFLLNFSFHSEAKSSDTNQILIEAESNVSLMLDELKLAMIEGDKNKENGKILLNKLLVKFYDSEQIAKYASMPYWRKASDSEKKNFSAIFKKYLINLASNWFNGFNDVNYLITSSELRGKSFVIVDILLKDPGTKRHNTKLSLRLKNNYKNELRIIDVEIENISMVLVQNDEFKSILRKNNGKFDSLIANLNVKLLNEK